jgi:hypothetical protein
MISYWPIRVPSCARLDDDPASIGVDKVPGERCDDKLAAEPITLTSATAGVRVFGGSRGNAALTAGVIRRN